MYKFFKVNVVLYKTRLAKLRYKDNMEERFTKGNTKAAWQNLNMMMGRAQASSRVQGLDPASFAEQLNVFILGLILLILEWIGIRLI